MSKKNIALQALNKKTIMLAQKLNAKNDANKK